MIIFHNTFFFPLIFLIIAVLLCDRGTMDGAAYIPATVWNKLMERHGSDTLTLRDTRYNAVFHLVTAADGAVEFYGSKTNEIRSESAGIPRAPGFTSYPILLLLLKIIIIIVIIIIIIIYIYIYIFFFFTYSLHMHNCSRGGCGFG